MADTTDISIFDQTVRVPNLYAEGHTLSAIEAKVLNRCRAENVANNRRKFIKEAIDSGDANAIAEAVAEAEAYALEYAFSEASTGGSTRTKLSPLEAECRRLAKGQVAKYLAANNKKKADVDPDKYEAEVARVSQMDAIVKLAKKNLKELEAAVGELDLDVAA
jgi:hypothetical protein